MAPDGNKPHVPGPLRLKGIGAIRINKNKKKKKKPLNDIRKEKSCSGTNSSTNVAKSSSSLGDINEEDKPLSDVESLKPRLDQDEDDHEDRSSRKTPSERAYEEMRKKRLIDRLAKDGLKTHKQRVEELNKYLSNLSEHHDMPRIGPG